MTHICMSQKQKKLGRITSITNHKEGEETEISVNSNIILHTSVEYTKLKYMFNCARFWS